MSTRAIRLYKQDQRNNLHRNKMIRRFLKRICSGKYKSSELKCNWLKSGDYYERFLTKLQLYIGNK